MKKALIIFIAIIAVPSIGISGFVLYDILQDQQHVVVIEDSVRVYADGAR